MGTSKLIFKIAADGGTTIEGDGFKGGSCVKEAEKFLQALGTLEKQSLKSEFYQGEEASVVINN